MAEPINKREKFFDLLYYLQTMNDRGNLKEDIISLIKEAYFFTHGEDDV